VEHQLDNKAPLALNTTDTIVPRDPKYAQMLWNSQ